MGAGRSGAVVSAAVAILLGAAQLSCQTQKFYPMGGTALAAADDSIPVVGKQLPPNIMLVVDRSGSMTESVTGTGLACTVDGLSSSDYDPRSTNPCKWNDLKSAIADPQTGFLTQAQGLARFGLLPFPASTGTCDTGTIAVPIGDDPQPIRDQLLNRVVPGGGTPTAASLSAAMGDAALATSEPGRHRFLMLLTDGLPNCNAANQAACAACRADASTCSAPGGCHPTDPPADTCDTTPFDGAGCLDEANLVNAVMQLRGQGIDTFVIGFGKDTTGGDASSVLNAAAVAGGHPLDGPVQYYQANSVQQLSQFLQDILQAFPCSWTLDPVPADPSLVQVSVHDVAANSDTTLKQGSDWSFTATPGEIQVGGDWCSRIQNASAGQYVVDVRYVNPL